MKDLRRYRIHYYFGKLLFYFAIAVLVFIFRNHFVDEVKYFVGTLALFYGLEGLFFEWWMHREKLFHQDKFYLSCIEVFLGIILLACPLYYESVCVVWAVWSIIREADEIKDIVTELRHWFPRILSAIESIAVIVFSVYLMIDPSPHHVLIHIYLLMVELLVTPLTPLVDEAFSAREESKES